MAVNPATNLSLSLGVSFIQLNWTNSTTVGATHTIYRSRGVCGTYVPIATSRLTPYLDYNVSNGETYAYYIVAQVGSTSSVPTSVLQISYVGAVDSYKASLTSQDAKTEEKGAVTVYSGSISNGGGEYQRLQQLRGKVYLCGK